MPTLSPTPANSPVRPDRLELQGVWTTIAGPAEARLLIVGNHYAFEFVGGAAYIGTYELVPGETTRQMDMHIEAGPVEHRDLITRCLYQIEGDIMRWCPGKPGSGRSPVAFPSVDDKKYLSLVFRRTQQPLSSRPARPQA